MLKWSNFRFASGVQLLARCSKSRWLQPFALGLLAALALPPINLWLALFVALPLFLHSLETAPKPFWRGWAFGFGYFCFALHWIGFAFLVDASTYLWMMPFAVGGLAAFLAIYWGLAAWIAHVGRMRWGMPLFLTYPALIAAAEMLRGRLFTGFPWAAPGQSVDGMGGVLQLASLIGMEGLTLLIMLWAATPLVLLKNDASRREKILVLSLLALLPLSWAWGVMRLQAYPTQFDDKVVVRIVQPNVLQGEKWEAAQAADIFERLLALSESDTATHIVWPESSVPFLIDESEEGRRRLSQDMRSNQTLIAGAVRRSEKTADADFFTSVLVFNAQGDEIGVYDKWRLVPGGEFLPMEWLLEPLGFKRLVTLPGGFKWGPGPKSVTVPGIGLAAMLICYEVVFPNQLVDAKNPPSVIVNVTNDGWFGDSTGPRQHLAQARLRAVEHGLPLIRSANTGISAVIDPMGRIIRSTQIDEELAIESVLPKPENTAPFAEYHSFVALLLIFLALVIAPSLSRKLK